RGGFAAFGPRTERVLRDSGHGIDHRVAELEELFLLLAHEGRELALGMIIAEQRLARALNRFLGRNFASRLFCGLFGRSFFLFCLGDNPKGARRGDRRKNGGLDMNNPLLARGANWTVYGAV